LTVELLVIGLTKNVDLERVFVCQVSDKSFLVRAKAFHGFSEGFGVGICVPSYLLRRAIA
jgi:hypothetical protein